MCYRAQSLTCGHIFVYVLQSSEFDLWSYICVYVLQSSEFDLWSYICVYVLQSSEFDLWSYICVYVLQSSEFDLWSYICVYVLQSSEFDLVVMYLVQALCELRCPDALQGVYSWCKEVVGKRVTWIKTAVDFAAGR